MERPALVLATLILLAAQATAQAPVELAVASVHTQDLARIEGHVAALRANATGEAPVGSLTIDAATIAVEVEGVHDGTSFLGGASDPQPYRDGASMANARLEAVRLGGQADLWVLEAQPGLATIALQTLGAMGAAPVVPSLAPANYVGDAPAPVPLDGSVLATAATTVSLTVEGSFTLRAWDVDLALSGDGTTRVFATGQRYEDAAGEPLGVRVAGTMDAAEAEVVVTDGILRLELSGIAPALVVSPWLDVALRGALAAQGATLEATTGPLALEGDVRASLRSLGSQKLGLVVHDADEAVLGGRPLTVAVEAAGMGLGWTWTIALLAVALALAAAARQARMARRMALLRKAMAADDHARAAGLFRSILASRRHRADAAFLGTLALARLEDATSALAVLRNEGLWRRAAPGIRLFLLAYVQALLGQAMAARASLAASLREAPELGAEARENPTLARLMAGAAGADGYT